MAEPIGIAWGAAGLASIFVSCIDIWDLVDAGKTHENNFSLLRAKLDNQRNLFVMWGKRLGFASSEGMADGSTTHSLVP
jgi:hypothetical protein